MNELLPILLDTIGDETTQTVNARDLHGFLKIKKHFTDWIGAQINRGKFLENRDYVVFHQKGKNPQGGRPTTDYHLTIDCGKQIAMMSGTDKGAEVREYFLDVERQLKVLAVPRTEPVALIPSQVARQSFDDIMAIADMAAVPKHYALQEAAGIATRQSGIDITPLITKAPAMNDVPDEEVLLEPTQLAHVLGLDSGAEANKKLQRLGLQERIAGQWQPTKEGKPLCERHAWVSQGKSGYNWKWRAAAIEQLILNRNSEA